MKSPPAVLAVPPLGAAPAYRRQHRKSDGRELFLYGRSPPLAEPLPELPAEPPAAGSELRWHPLRDEWNVYAAHRQTRTHLPASDADPLAPSRPGQPATEIPFADFELAIFENRFPSFAAPTADSDAAEGASVRPARGRCEVVVYAPEQTGSLATLSADRRLLLLQAWADRYQALHAAGHAYVLPFENRGVEAGVTLPHPHGQIYAFPFVPDVQQRAVAAFAAGFDLAAAVRRSWAELGVAEAGDALAWCPPFARFPYEVWIVPRVRRAGPWEFTAAEAEGVAALLGEITRRYDRLFGRDTPYMLALHAAPAALASPFHVSAQFYPLLRAPDRVKFLAGVEQATGVFTVDVLPERAAAALRALA